MNYSNSYPLDTVYGTSVPYEYSETSIPIPFKPEAMSAPSYQFPTVSSEIDYSNILETGGAIDPPNENEIENKKENENMLKALRLFSIEYTEKQLKNALKRLDIANKKIKQFEEKLEYLKSNEIYDSSLIDRSFCSVS